MTLSPLTQLTRIPFFNYKNDFIACIYNKAYAYTLNESLKNTEEEEGVEAAEEGEEAAEEQKTQHSVAGPVAWRTHAHSLCKIGAMPHIRFVICSLENL